MSLSPRATSAALFMLLLALSEAEANAQNSVQYGSPPTQQAYPQPGPQGNYAPPFSPQYSQGFAPQAGANGLNTSMPYGPGAPPMQQGMAGQGLTPYQPAPSGFPGYQPLPDAARNSTSLAIPVNQWFSHYDQIRHQAQMSPQERQRADQLMSRGLSILVPGDEKVATKNLLSSLAVRYQRACQDLSTLPQISQTSNLHQNYFQYFSAAGQLFNDYVRVQDNIFVTDASTGKPLAASLLQRKQVLQGLEHQCKQLDAQTRAQFGVPPYPW
jgi:hypothetical protein